MADYTAFVEAGNGLVELLRENMTPEPISSGICNPCVPPMKAKTTSLPFICSTSRRISRPRPRRAICSRPGTCSAWPLPAFS